MGESGVKLAKWKSRWKLGGIYPYVNGGKNVTNFSLGRLRWPGLKLSISGIRVEISGWKSPFWILGWKLLVSKLASGLVEFYADWVRGKNQEGKLGKLNNSCCIYKFWLFVNWLDYGFIWHFCGTDYYMLSFLIRIWSIFWSWKWSKSKRLSHISDLWSHD